MEVSSYLTARQGPSLGLIIRLLIGLIVGLIGGPLWIFVTAQVGFEFYRASRNRASEHPFINIGVAVLGWFIGSQV